MEAEWMDEQEQEGEPLSDSQRKIEDDEQDEKAAEAEGATMFAVVFLAGAGFGSAPKVYPLGRAGAAGEAACGLVGSSRPEQLTPVLFPEPERVLRFPVLIRPQDGGRRGKANPVAHELADDVGLAANGLCPDCLHGPMLVAVPSEELAWLLVDFAAAPKATRDADARYRPLFMYEVNMVG